MAQPWVKDHTEEIPDAHRQPGDRAVPHRTAGRAVQLRPTARSPISSWSPSRLRDAEGAEGVGYTYTTGAGGSAVHALIDEGLRHVLMGADADQIEALWQRMWWRLHYGGRGGSVSLAVSACDIAL